MYRICAREQLGEQIAGAESQEIVGQSRLDAPVAAIESAQGRRDNLPPVGQLADHVGPLAFGPGGPAGQQQRFAGLGNDDQAAGQVVGRAVGPDTRPAAGRPRRAGPDARGPTRWPAGLRLRRPRDGPESLPGCGRGAGRSVRRISFVDTSRRAWVRGQSSWWPGDSRRCPRKAASRRCGKYCLITRPPVAGCSMRQLRRAFIFR